MSCYAGHMRLGHGTFRVMVRALAALLVAALAWFGWQFADLRSRARRIVDRPQSHRVAIVFGAGVREGRPSDALDDRLKVAARLYHEGSAQRLLVSGDNSTSDYNEPDVMRDALIETYGVDPDDVFADYAGRRTYDTCIRAHDLWGVRSAILVSQRFHLPRAVWTCEKLGIASVGANASLQPYVLGSFYRLREVAASLQAIIDVHLWHPRYIGGPTLPQIDAE